MGRAEDIVVGRRLPVLESVRPLDPLRVEVTWECGERAGAPEIVDLAPFMARFALYRPLEDNSALFATARLGPYGSSIEWGDGSIDISSVAVEDVASDAEASLEFKTFLAEQGWTFDVAARRLGLGRRTVAYYAAGRPLPKTVALACRYFQLASAQRRQEKDGFRRRRRTAA
ncbi:hypothetical protein [Salinarimonas rosea]|uniref:hypothetical protein n=1 Tax=Salinarimonas rosea TaxID=552063 RepID=UPI0003FBE522|nr:hypothetical protein [Salinarimonas rosea]